MRTYICKCGKTFEKSTKAETTGYELTNYSPQHECYGCPYIVTDRGWQKRSPIIKRECRATPKITYLSKCHIGTVKGDFTACKVYSLDLTFVKRVMNYVNSLDGAEKGDRLNCIPGEWRAADFGMCYSSDDCFGLAIFNLYFQNNKAGTAARRLVKERFFTESGVRRDMTEEEERENVLMRIEIAKENARKALEQNDGEPTEVDIALFEQYSEYFGRYCRFDKAYGADHKYTKQHYAEAQKIYDKIVSQGLEQAYKTYREERLKLTEEEDTMARKLQFDAAITRDIQSAMSDSFVDNIKMIDVSEIAPSKENFYEISSIELLADDIEREGLKHNLVVSKDKNSAKYWLKSGHRRFAAVQLLIEQKRLKSTKVPCYVDGEKSKAESKLDLIMLNATQRKYTDAEVMSEYEQLSQTLKELDGAGKGLGGRMRENIAKILNVSNGQVGKMDNIKHNAAPEVKAAVESGKMSISTANEVAKLAPEKQKEVVEKKPDISSAEVKKMQDKKPTEPPKSKPVGATKKPSEPEENTEDLDEDDTDEDIDERFDKLNEKFREEIAEGKPQTEPKKASTFSLILSEKEAKALLKLINDNIIYADNDDELVTIQCMLESFVSE